MPLTKTSHLCYTLQRLIQLQLKLFIIVYKAKTIQDTFNVALIIHLHCTLKQYPIKYGGSQCPPLKSLTSTSSPLCPSVFQPTQGYILGFKWNEIVTPHILLDIVEYVLCRCDESHNGHIQDLLTKRRNLNCDQNSPFEL